MEIIYIYLIYKFNLEINLPLNYIFFREILRIILFNIILFFLF